ncbi:MULTISPECIES: hypothetical protein [Pseudomonas]|uniref:hypothetical protein n=1 Tax=Pseudomonas TaxID=286 RepID=UPI003990161A
MSVFMVTWNLNKEGPNYSEARRLFVQHLDRYESVRDIGLDSVRWVRSAGTAKQVSDDLSTKIDSNDRLVVTKMNRDEYYGWLDKGTWDWIQARL